MYQIPDNYYDESAVLALQKHRNERTPIEVFYMTKYFRQFQCFYGYNDEIIRNCCSKMRYEIIHPNQLIFKRFDQITEDQKKFYIILQGELGIYLSIGLLPENIKDVEFKEVSTIKMYQHFGHQLFCLTKEDIFEQYGLIIKAKKQTLVATLNFQYFHAYLFQSEQRKISYEISRLYDFCLFKEIQYKELKDKVCTQGDQAYCVYFILRGQYSIVRRINEHEIQTLGIISEGEIIGEYEILNNIDTKPYTLLCQSEKGEILICDSQLFLNYVFLLIRDNLEQTIEAKFNFHQMDKTSIKFELNKQNQNIHRRQSIEDVCRQNKYHYLMRPIRRKVHLSNSEYYGKQSYYQLFVDIYNIASTQTQLANDERKRRITHYVRNTLKPMQQKLKSALNISANKTDESIIKYNKGFPLHNEMLIQALKRNNESRFRKTFQKTQSLANISPSKKQSRADIIDLGEHLIIKKQYKSNIYYDKLLRQEILFCRNQQTIQECIQLLLKDPTIRLEQENEKLEQFLRGHEFFRLSDNQFLKDCCQLMRFEQFQKNQVIFQKNDFDKNKVIIILTGDVVFNKGNQEMIHLQHFGSNLLILGSEYYAEIPDWYVISKTPCKVAAISRHDFRVNLLTSELSRVTKEISNLYSLPIFLNVPYSKVRKFYANSVTQTFQQLDIVYLQEQMVKQIYLVIYGIFELRELEKGVAKAVHIYTQGQLIGENEFHNQSSLRNGTAFCISEEGLLLLFDSQYFQEHVFPLIIDNISRSSSIQKFKNQDSDFPKLSLTREFNQKRTISRQYNFKRSSDNLDVNSNNQSKPNTKFLQSRKSSLSFNSISNSQTNLLEEASQIFINNFQQKISKYSEDTLINSAQIINSQELNRTTKRKSQKSNRILNDNNQLESNKQDSSNRFILNRQNQFLKTTQKLTQTNFQQKPYQQQLNSRASLNNQLLNKFLNRKEEYGDIASKNQMRRTLSQTIIEKKTIKINK